MAGKRKNPETETPAVETQSANEPEAPVAPGDVAVETPADETTADATPADTEATVAEAEPAPDVEAVAAAPEKPKAAPKQARKPAAAKAEPKPKPKAKAKPAAKPKKPAAKKPAARKPIVRLPKPEHERGRSQERRGVVVSSAMEKTIVVKVDTIKAHRRYKKVVRRSAKFHAHDEQNQAKVGDVVRIVETRPLSKTKNWRLVEVLEAAR